MFRSWFGPFHTDFAPWIPDNDSWFMNHEIEVRYWTINRDSINKLPSVLNWQFESPQTFVTSLKSGGWFFSQRRVHFDYHILIDDNNAFDLFQTKNHFTRIFENYILWDKNATRVLRWTLQRALQWAVRRAVHVKLSRVEQKVAMLHKQEGRANYLYRIGYLSKVK